MVGFPDHVVDPNDKVNKMVPTNFGWALETLKMGKRVQRIGWNGKGMFIELQVPDDNSKMTLPYIYMYTACKNKVPWLASQTDILSSDWCISK
jgi:hypothetical protein